MRARSPTRRPARARCRSTRRRRSCSTAPTTRRASSTCRRSATSTRASRIPPSRRSRNASRRWRAAARRSPPPPGMAAQMRRAARRCCEQGDHIVAARTLYGGTYSQFAVTFAQFGIDTTFVDRRRSAEFRARDHDRTPRRSTPRRSAIRSSTCSTSRRSPTIAHEAGIPLVIDNTLASPYLCRPFEHGADIVVHSATKYLGGHGTTMGGIIVESGKFPWDNGNFPADDRAVARLSRRALLRDVRRFRLHDEGAHGDDAHARARRCRRSTRSCCCRESRRCTCAWTAHCANALAVAQFLAAHPRVAWVNYPGLPSSQYYALAQQVPAQGRGRHPDVRHQGRRRGRRAIHRGARSSCRTSPTSATRRRWSSIPRRPRTASCRRRAGQGRRARPT